MIFSSLEFIFIFFPMVFIGYILIKPKYSNCWLLMASLIFYYLGAKEQLGLLISVIILAYVTGLTVEKVNSTVLRQIAICISIIIMLLVMGYYKYWNFLIYNLNILFHRSIQSKTISLPIGISFFVFQAISYVVDVYRGERALKNPIDMGLYISFFPQLIAGPIVRFHDISGYLNKKYRVFSYSSASNGIWRFAIGFCKKILIANNLGGLVDLVFGVSDISQFSIMYTWLGAAAYTLQIYYDFSGYSDMAIGLGKIFGFEFQENFNYPYAASSIKDFWRRWHISLSQFFRDYVYIPMGGNKCSKLRWASNILFVWLLTGLWHGASWNYILWGLSYGILLLIERFIEEKFPDAFRLKTIRHILTMFIVIILWVIFKCEHLSSVVLYLKNMFGFSNNKLIDDAFLFQAKNFALLIVASSILALPISNILPRRIKETKTYQAVGFILLCAGVISSISYIYMGSYNPFLYFMF